MVSSPYYARTKRKDQPRGPSNPSGVFVTLSTLSQLVSHLNKVFPYAVERLTDAWVCIFLKEICGISLAYLIVLLRGRHFIYFLVVKEDQLQCFVFIWTYPIGISHG